MSKKNQKKVDLRKGRSLVVHPELVFVVEVADPGLPSRSARLCLVDRHPGPDVMIF
jgi:hypothetical protein